MNEAAQRELRILVPTGMLGFGFPLASFEKNLALDPHAIGVDAGSTDLGPHNLGGGIVEASRSTTKRDLDLILQASLARRIPVIIGSAGTSGSDSGIQWMLDIVREISWERGSTLRVAKVHAEQDKPRVKRKIREGRVRPLGPEPKLTPEIVDEATRLVALMGVEPLIRALEVQPDLVIAGRSCDAAIFASVAIKEGFPKGLAWHLGQILECGAMCSEAGHSAAECITGIIRDDHFVVGSPSDAVVCTPRSVAAQSFYEESHPSRLSLPGGYVWTGDSRFEQLDQGWVQVSGSQWHDADDYEVLLEGAGLAGYRTMMVAGVRDPILIAQIDHVIREVEQETAAEFDGEQYRLDFIVYGRDGVMGALEPSPRITSHEIGLVIDVIAGSQDLSSTVLDFVRHTIDHYKYEGIKATAANLAVPMAPATVPCGAVYQFTVHHLMTVDDPHESFSIEIEQLG